MDALPSLGAAPRFITPRQILTQRDPQNKAGKTCHNSDKMGYPRGSVPFARREVRRSGSGIFSRRRFAGLMVC